MGNRTSRHLKPGNQNLRGRKSATICPCCDSMINHKEDILARIAQDEIDDALAASKTPKPLSELEAQ
jgi:hypothetical protein